MESEKISALGVGWYEEADYPEILAIMEDAAVLPATFAEWRKAADQLVRRFESQGVKVVKAVIKPKEFLGWCATRGLKINADARTRFANEEAARSVKGRMH
jgi:hypothetical protein